MTTVVERSAMPQEREPNPAMTSCDSEGAHASPSVSRTAPVMTAFTLGWASAALVSMLRMRAWASGLRRIAPWSMPGSTMSST